MTLVPDAYDSEQSEPHEIPAGLLVTVPDPPPPFDTVKVNPVVSSGNEDAAEDLSTSATRNAFTPNGWFIPNDIPMLLMPDCRRWQ